MKKLLITFLLVMTLALTMVVIASAAEITVVDDGTTEITLGECVIEGLGKEIPAPTEGLTYVLDTETKTATVTALADEATTVTLVVPSTVTYEGEAYKVTTVNKLLNGTRSNNNEVLITLYLPDTIETIGDSAFQYALCAEYVYIGKGVKSIGKEAFRQLGFRTYYQEGGCVKEFICKSKNIETIGESAFFAREISNTAVLEFDLMNLKSVGANAFSTSGYITNGDHHYTGCPTIITSIDLTNGVVYQSNSFTLGGGNQATLTWKYIKIYADELSKIRLDTAVSTPATIHLVGGETPETARTLPKALFQAGLTYWTATGGNRFIFDGYIKAYDGIDGVTSANDKSPYVDYYFANATEFNYYINSVKATTNGATTLANYAGYKFGYFVICNGNGTFTEYCCTYNSETGEFALTDCAEANKTATAITYGVLLDGYCTESTLCMVCDCTLNEGIKHEYKTTVTYADFTKGGVKTIGCTHDFCAMYANPTVVELGAIFSEFYYSVREDETLFGLVMTYKVNNEALAEYETVNGHLNFGVMAIAKKRITTTEGESEVITNPLKNDGTTELSNVVVANVSSNTLASVNLIITGSGDAWEEAKGVEFYVLGFAVNGEALQYFQNSSNTSIGELSTITYNDAKEVA